MADDPVAHWNEVLVARFVRFRAIMAGGIGRHGDVALARHPPAAGARALDVGCGFGESTRALAKLVGARGSVLGVDVCEPFLTVARQEAAAARIENVDFLCADAGSHVFAAPFDLIASRFGTMFFADPAAAFGNLRAALRPGGSLLILVWRRLTDNPWLGVGKRAVLEHLPAQPGRGGPGPFSQADPDALRALLTGAGFCDVTCERLDLPFALGPLDEAVELLLAIGPGAELLLQAGAAAGAKRAEIAADLRARLAAHLENEVVVLPSSSWCVTARAGS